MRLLLIILRRRGYLATLDLRHMKNVFTKNMGKENPKQPGNSNLLVFLHTIYQLI